MLRTIAEGVVVPSGESTEEDEDKDCHDNPAPALAHYRLPGSTDNTYRSEHLTSEMSKTNRLYSRMSNRAKRHLYFVFYTKTTICNLTLI